jgi:hypothetical protein
LPFRSKTVIADATVKAQTNFGRHRLPAIPAASGYGAASAADYLATDDKEVAEDVLTFIAMEF